MNIRNLLAMTVVSGTALNYAVADTQQDWTDSVKGALTVYNNEDTLVQKVKLGVLEQMQMVSVQPNGSNSVMLSPGSKAFNQEIRYTWLSVDVDFSSHTKFHAWTRVGGMPGLKTSNWVSAPRVYTYADLFDIWVKQDITSVKGLSVTAGKVAPMFTTDYMTPTAALPCLERSILSNQYGLDSNWGVQVEWAPTENTKVFGQFLANDRACNHKDMWHGDVYRDGRGLKGEFGWEDKCFIIIGAEHKFAVTENGYHKVSGQYMHDFNNAYHDKRWAGNNNYGLGYKDALSLGYEMKHGRVTVVSNLVASFEQQAGIGTNNLGWQIQPVVAVNPHVDVVFRYSGMVGRNACALGSDRFIDAATMAPFMADSMHSFYVGANYYVSEKDHDAVKVMFGAEYTTARSGGSDCYNGWTFMSGVRVSF